MLRTDVFYNKKQSQKAYYIHASEFSSVILWNEEIVEIHYTPFKMKTQALKRRLFI